MAVLSIKPDGSDYLKDHSIRQYSMINVLSVYNARQNLVSNIQKQVGVFTRKSINSYKDINSNQKKHSFPDSL